MKKKNNVIKLKTEFLKNELDLPYGAIEEEIIDESRWSLTLEIIFEYEGKYYQTWYSKGKTEMQDESPWEYEDEAECTEVEKKLVQVEKWVPVEL
jgi:hypothetical protein